MGGQAILFAAAHGRGSWVDAITVVTQTSAPGAWD
jgi:hypothetical protein